MVQSEQTLTLEKKISILSQIGNYYAKTDKSNNKKMRNGKALKLLSTITDEEAQVIFNNPTIQDTIFKIDNTDILRAIFRKVPAFFQEKMFNNDKIQEKLITPRQFLKKEELFQIYKTSDIVFSDEEIKQLENFLHSIKSPKICEEIVENKFFQTIIALCLNNQVKSSFFKGIDEVKIFNNIINDDEIYKTKMARRKNIHTIFNTASNHILLADDCANVVNLTELCQNKWQRFMFDSRKIIVDERTLMLMPTLLIEELLENNSDKDFIKAVLVKNLQESLRSGNYDFDKIFAYLFKYRYRVFNKVDYLYFRVIIEECQNNEALKDDFVDFIYKKSCPEQELDENETNYLKDCLYNRIKTNNVPESEYRNVFFQPSLLKTAFYLKFGKIADRVNYLNGISFEQLKCLNVKHVNQIVKSLKLENEDEISNIYGIAIKLYLTFGLERSLKILNGDYGELNRTFFDNISSLKTKKVTFTKEGSKYLPNISSEFIGFMFATQKNNHFTYLLNNPTSYFGKYWYYLYNDFDKIKEKCHGVITLKKLNILLQQFSPSRDINDISPDNYRLKENDILNDICLGNKTELSNEEIYKNVLDIYEQMKKRTESSIPYVKGSCSNGYSYEMMKLNDPIAFTLGYKGNCCIRTKDIAHEHLLHATLCRNGRILLIYNEAKEIAGFVPLKRNGEVLIANSIECAHKIIDEKAIAALEDAVKEIVNVSQKNVEEQHPINLVCIGTEAYARPKGIPFPNNIATPTIYEKNEETYKDTDCYHTFLTIIYQSPTLDLNNIIYENPRCSYKDPRTKISSCDFNKSTSTEQEKALKIINAVRYASCKESDNFGDLEEFTLLLKYGNACCVYNDDWYIIGTNEGNIYSDYLKNDERAIAEYNTALEEFKKHFSNNHQQNEDGPKLTKKL